jgi:hypothetical protein
MIVLNKVSGQTEQPKLIRPECFRKKPAIIFEDVGNQDHNIV